MAKACDCAGLLEMVTRDPRLRTLPAAARMLWLELVMAMRVAGVSVLRFGADVPDTNALAMLVAMSPGEVAANIEPLVGRGLLVREADGALGSPMLAAAAARSDINRANALAGVEKRRRRRSPDEQMELRVMSTVGGTDVAGAMAGERAAKPRGSPDTAIAKLDSKTVKLAVDEAEFHSTGRAVLEIMGVDPAKSVVHYGIVRQWLADGASPELILDVVRRKMRPGISNPGYFGKAIAEALARQPMDLDVLPESSRRWTEAVTDWMRNGCQGEKPEPAFYRPGGKYAAAA
jgi:hypothetical protein